MNNNNKKKPSPGCFARSYPLALSSLSWHLPALGISLMYYARKNHVLHWLKTLSF